MVEVVSVGSRPIFRLSKVDTKRENSIHMFVFIGDAYVIPKLNCSKIHSKGSFIKHLDRFLKILTPLPFMDYFT